MSQVAYRIAACGLSPREERIVGIILSRVPSTQFRYVWSASPTGEPCDIVLVDPHAHGGQAALERLRVHSPLAIPVYLADTPTPERRGYHISRRSLWSHLVCTLDDIAQSGARGSMPGLRHNAPAAAIRATDAASAPGPAPALTHIRALVLDDSITVRNQIEGALLKLGIRSEGASNWTAAFELLEREVFDLMFLDVVMPGVDGYEVCKRVRRNAATRRLPVVMLTSRSSAFDRARGALAGCDLYLVKPIDVTAFHQAVNKIVAKLCTNDLSRARLRGFIPTASWSGNASA